MNSNDDREAIYASSVTRYEDALCHGQSGRAAIWLGVMSEFPEFGRPAAHTVQNYDDAMHKAHHIFALLVAVITLWGFAIMAIAALF